LLTGAYVLFAGLSLQKLERDIRDTAPPKHRSIMLGSSTLVLGVGYLILKRI
jgi:hypothetical protein